MSAAPVDTPTGIDLHTRQREVENITLRHWGYLIRRYGLDQDEVLQDVHRGILARNEGKCPWDGRKSTWGHYVWLASKGIIINHIDKVMRVRSHEVLGRRDRGSHVPCDTDAAESAVSPSPGGFEHVLEDLQAHLRAEGQYDAAEVAPLLAMGYSARDVAQARRVSVAEATALVGQVRDGARHWARGEDA